MKEKFIFEWPRRITLALKTVLIISSKQIIFKLLHVIYIHTYIYLHTNRPFYFGQLVKKKKLSLLVLQI